MTTPRFEYRILGSFDVCADGEQVALRGGKQRALLAILLLRPNQTLPIDTLVEELWGDEAPETAANALQVYVSQLRKVLPDGVLVTQPPGYRLRLEPDQLDLARFERLVARGREELAAERHEEAAALLREALDLWRGEPLADFAFEPFAQAEIRRLEELRVAALEDRIEADLALGRHAQLVGELEILVEQQPLRERLRAQLMRALYRSGRQAEALDEYRKARRTLVDELGIEPGPELQALEKAILAQDPMLAPPAHVPAPAAPKQSRLPVPATPLVGRETELREAADLARRDDVRLVTFTGPGGIGKTRLALEVARTLAPEFADGAAFVPLASIRDPALLDSTILDVLGGTGESLEDHIRGRTLLLLLDNFEQLLDAAPRLAALLAEAPELKLLVTSRAVLRLSGEHEFPVPPLAVPEWEEADAAAVRSSPAVALFVQRAEAADPAFVLTDDNADAVAAVCARLDGLPLAIELAAARTKLLPPAAMLARLSRRLDLLTAGARDAPERQQTLRATLDWSYDALDERDQRLFVRVAVFVRGCMLEAAEAVCSEGGIDVLEGLASLVDKSLLRRRGEAEPRFVMLETVREYAREHLERSGEAEQVRARHARYFLELAETAEPEFRGSSQHEWMARIARDHDNFRAALEFAFETGEAETALRLAAALRQFWEYHGYLAEGRRAIETALEHVEEAPPLVRAKALNGAGVLAGEQGDFDVAERYFGASLEVARELGDATRIAAATSNLGNLAMFRRDYDRARELFAEAWETWREANDEARATVVIESLGLLAILRGDLDEARERFEYSLALARSAGHMHSTTSLLHTLGRVHILQGDLDAAAELLEEALQSASDLEPRLAADCLDTVGGFAAAKGLPERAAELFGAADELRASIAAVRTPDQQPWYDDNVERLRAQLGGDFDAAYTRGRQLSVDEAVELALGVGAPA